MLLDVFNLAGGTGPNNSVSLFAFSQTNGSNVSVNKHARSPRQTTAGLKRQGSNLVRIFSALHGRCSQHGAAFWFSDSNCRRLARSWPFFQESSVHRAFVRAVQKLRFICTRVAVLKRARWFGETRASTHAAFADVHVNGCLPYWSHFHWDGRYLTHLVTDRRER